ncbi:hypothetical protein [Saccharibacillus alkalitolerans]|uniref:Lipoprotein n=1 Tax=Saccharibacillus alkalitolerans TaxID=2705290 RepID=A0ABX0F9R0_9BACL|nr:hypothetical protein [Saccharibacillus alkalitolerans]NGZ77676.1 hypothetical protein [Saccharibacillus alkalitolerans]
MMNRKKTEKTSGGTRRRAGAKRRRAGAKRGGPLLLLAVMLTACQSGAGSAQAENPAGAPDQHRETQQEAGQGSGTQTLSANEKADKRSGSGTDAASAALGKEASPQKERKAQEAKTRAAGKSEAALIPAGWHALKQPNGGIARAEGDLNKDGIPDLALVIQQDGEEGEAMPRRLLLAFGEKGGGYRLSAIADHVVLSADEGGVWGDPFHGVTVEQGAVVIRHEGGSNDRWYNTYRFRYQGGDWKLIGATVGSYFTGAQTAESADEDDCNLATGDYVSRRTDEQGRVRVKKGNRGKHPLTTIGEFDINREMEKGLKP